MGIQYEFGRARVTDKEGPKLLDSENVPGSEGCDFSGIGITVTWDSRDNNLYPTSGSYHQFSASSYESFLGSDYKYNSYLLDVRHYRPVFSKHILAFQGVVGINTGNPPFQILNEQGSLGYYSVRGSVVPVNYYDVWGDFVVWGAEDGGDSDIFLYDAVSED